MNDKAYHMIAGLIIALLMGWLTHDALVGLAFAVCAGCVKEIWDYFGHGTSELNDIIATAQGGAVGLVLLIIIDALEVW